MAKARLLIQQKDYAGAVIFAQKNCGRMIAAGLWADDAVFMLGDIYENQLGR